VCKGFRGHLVGFMTHVFLFVCVLCSVVYYVLCDCVMCDMCVPHGTACTCTRGCRGWLGRTLLLLLLHPTRPEGVRLSSPLAPTPWGR